MTGSDPARRMTVVNWFTVKGEEGEFTRVFRDHARYLRSRTGFDFLVTVRLLEQPDIHLHLSHWRSREWFLQATQDPVFQEHVQKLGALVETEADQALSIDRTAVQNAVVGDRNVVVVRADDGDEDFVRTFRTVVEHCLRRHGFGGSDLLRSTVSPGRYLGVLWWRDTAACEQALLEQVMREWPQRQGVTVERAEHVAYARFLPH